MSQVSILKRPSDENGFKKEPWYKMLFKPLFFDTSQGEFIFKHLKNQMEQRDSSTKVEWDSFSENDKNNVFIIADILKDHLGWPNTFFIPADPAELVFWDQYGDLDLVEAIMAIEDEFDIKANDSYWQAINTKTFGEVVKDITNNKI